MKSIMMLVKSREDHNHCKMTKCKLKERRSCVTVKQKLELLL